MGFYEYLLKDRENLRKASQDDVDLFGDFLSGDVIKVSSLDDFLNFHRVGEDTLVHKAKKDLWRIGEGKNGDVFIERLFDPETGKCVKV